MCTLSWVYHSKGYRLLFTRDEGRGRSPALPPEIRSADPIEAREHSYGTAEEMDSARSHIGSPATQNRDLKYLAPRDPDGGGTWILVNAAGVTICLLNHYSADAQLMTGHEDTHRDSFEIEPSVPETRSPEPLQEPLADGDLQGKLSSKNSDGLARDSVSWTSRGLLVEKLSQIRERTAFENRLRLLLEADAYRPFLVLAFFKDGIDQPERWIWDGISLGVSSSSSPTAPESSSSFETETTIAARRRFFAALGPRPSLRSMLAFHRSHLPGNRLRSVCMHREYARSQSLCHIEVRDGDHAGEPAVCMRYADGPPCRTPFGSPLRLNHERI